jgi:N-acyl homoserine lactone hydrolase
LIQRQQKPDQIPAALCYRGDLYHYPAERALNRVPTFEFNQEQTRATRVATAAFLKKTDAQLWIQHDFRANARLRKALDYYG